MVRATVAAGILAGIMLSLPLWLTRISYPRVPLLDFIPAFPAPFDSFLLFAFAGGLLVLVWRPHLKWIGVFWFSFAAFLLAQDQSRLQPWFVEYLLLLALVVFSKSEGMALNGCRLVLAAVYFWSGVHKMNTSFATNLFPWLVSPFVGSGAEPIVQGAGLMVPFVEIALGIALLFPKTRRLGVVAIVAMHLFLLLVLSPLALGWNSVVAPWNIAMMVLVPFLFWQADVSARSLFAAPRALFIFLFILPCLSLMGRWDTSPSFALYSGNQLIGSVVLSESAWQRQDAQIQAVSERVGDRYRIRLDDWAVTATNVPAYPAERVLRRVAQSFCVASVQEQDVIFILEQPPQWLYRSGWHRIERRGEFCR
jgi:hypothetical protein